MLETVGVFEVPKQNGKYETGQVGIVLGLLSFSWTILFLNGTRFGQNTESWWYLYLFVLLPLAHWS